MRLMNRLFCLLAALALALPALRGSALAQGVLGRVAKVDIQFLGPATVNEDYVRGFIRVKAGDAYQPASVDQDVRDLYGTGMFYTVRILETRTDAGVELTYQIQAKPKLTDIRISGNTQIRERKIRKKITSKVGEPLDEAKLFSDAQEIKTLYQKTGRPNADVKYVTVIDEPAGRGTATFEIKESPKIRIEDVVFEGATAFEQSKLRKVVKTRRWWMFSWLTGSGKLKEDKLDEDREKLAEFYRKRGYIDFDLQDIKLEYPKTNRMVVHFQVFEGKPYKVGAVTFKGATMFPTNQADKLLNLSVGKTFTPGDLEKDVEKIQDFYGARGHIDVAEGTGNLRVARIANTEQNTMDLRYDIEEGQKSYVEKIEIRGNNNTKDRVIRRELAIAPGNTFDMVRVKVSKKRLEGLQYFGKVEAHHEPTDVPERKNLIVTVEEKSTGSVSVGAGFSSIDNLVGYLDLTQGNFDLFNPPTFQGAGQKARLHLALGTERYDVVLSFIEPWFLGRRLQLGTDFFHRRLNYQSMNELYDEARTGGRVSLTKALWRQDLMGRVSYTLENVGIINVSPLAPQTILDESGYNLLSTVETTLAFDTRNSSLLPNRGQRTEFITGVTGGPFGGDRHFYKLELRSGWYFRGLAKGHVLEVVGKAGVGEAFNGDATIPFYERWYLGGLYSLRGYKYRDVGPKEPVQYSSDYEPVGGNTYWFGSIEYSIPIIERLRLALFYDIGMVYPDSYSFEPQQYNDPRTGRFFTTGSYNDNWGIGIRLNLPIGPLRLDYGIPINSDDRNESGGRFQFGVGYTRVF